MNKLFLFFIIIFLILFPFTSQASLVPCGRQENDNSTPWNETKPCTICHFWLLGSNIINFITWDLGIPVAVLLFLAAGIVLLVSGDNEERRNLGKKIFRNTVIGLIIIFASWLLIDSFLKTIAKNDFSGAWNQFECPGM